MSENEEIKELSKLELMKIRQKAYYQRNKEKIIERQKDYNFSVSNEEKAKRAKKHYDKNRENILMKANNRYQKMKEEYGESVKVIKRSVLDTLIQI